MSLAVSELPSIEPLLVSLQAASSRFSQASFAQSKHVSKKASTQSEFLLYRSGGPVFFFVIASRLAKNWSVRTHRALQIYIGTAIHFAAAQHSRSIELLQ